jgi:hypothetical protein
MQAVFAGPGLGFSFEPFAIDLPTNHSTGFSPDGRYLKMVLQIK